MPEYLAPGVYVEETSFRAKSIEGVGTSTTSFVGPTRKGPVASLTEIPELLTSFADFERLYGGLADLRFGAADPGTAALNFLAHAVRAYFNEGGSRLYVARTYTARTAAAAADQPAQGLASSANFATGAGNVVRFSARFAGDCGNGAVRVREVESPGPATARRAAPVGSLIRTGAGAGIQFWLKVDTGFQEVNAAGNVGAVAADTAPANPVLLTLSVLATDGDGSDMALDDLGYAPAHPRYLGEVLRATPQRRAEQLENMYAVTITGVTPFVLRSVLLTAGGAGADPQPELLAGISWMRVRVTGGNDGVQPILGTDTATATNERGYELALAALARLEDISIVAAPGASAYATNANDAIMRSLITHAEGRRRYRIAVLDTAELLTPGEAREARARIDSTLCGAVLPVGRDRQPECTTGQRSVAKRDLAAALGLRLRHLRAQRHRARRAQGAGQRGRARRAALRTRDQLRRAGSAEPARHQLPALLPRPRLPRLGRAHRELGPRVEVRQRPALLQLPRALDRPRHAVGRVRAERRATVGEHPRDGRRLPLQRVAQRRAARRDDRRRPSSCAATARR